MPPQAPKSPYLKLVETAEAFAEELRSYALLSETFQRQPMVSSRHLERINETLTAISDCEQRLGVTGQALAQAVAEARNEQERVARATLDRIPAVKSRTEALGKLIARFDELGREAGSLNEVAANFTGTDPGEGSTDQARALAYKILTLAERAQEVAAAAHTEDFEELARRGHALYQQLLAAHKKLTAATLSQ